MKKSTELEILIESIKVSLLEQSTDNLVNLLKNNKINWERLEKMATFHAIRPVVYDALQRANFENEFSQKLKERTFAQAITNLATSQELARLLALLQSQNIRVLPYKGLLFILELYKNKPLREAHDLDLLIHPDDAKRALNILIEDGYVLDTNNEKYETKEIIEIVINTYGFIEAGLDKKTDLGIEVHIDFHWGFFEEYFSYKIDFKEFFKTQIKKEYSGQNLFFPSDESLFFMLLNHHGARESWLRLKHFCDLIMLFQTKSLSFQALSNLSKKASMTRIFELGCEIYQSQFLEQSIPKTNKALQSNIYYYWEIAELWSRLDLRIRFEYIHYKLHDNFSLKKFSLSNYKFFSKPNLFENPRLITFPDKYKFLNFSSKVITFVWKKTFKKIFSSQ